MAKVIPSLSELGWITDSRMMLSKILSYYLLTDSSQSVSFQGNLISLPYTYHLHINDPNEMAVTVREDLNTLLGRYFEQYEVITRVKEGLNKAVTILIYAYIIDDSGTKVSLGRVLEMDTEGLKKAIEINNEGEGHAYLGAG